MTDEAPPSAPPSAPLLERVDLRGRPDPYEALLPRPGGPGDDRTAAAVREIVTAVRERGDEALREYTERFDGCRIGEVAVPAGDREAALDRLDPALRVALEVARDQILAWHEAQHEKEARHHRAGFEVHELVVPVDCAGCYVPGGRAVYPSTVLMTAIPARVAGVPRVVVCVPPGDDGRVPDVTLAAAALASVDEVYRVGGAQAIAALAYGTESIPRVDVVVGPGNAYVTEAKRQVIGRVGIDGLAGPSEVAALADATVPPELVAADLLAQAEHGPGGAAVVIAWEAEVLDAVERALASLLAVAPRRADAEATLRAGGRAVLVDDRAHAIEVANAIAPEHLELLCADAELLVPGVRNAGAVFVGPYTPAVLGDYVAGVNHVLPTGATARFASALRVANFQKRIQVVSTDREGLTRMAPYVALLAETEGLPAHAAAVRLREARGAP